MRRRVISFRPGQDDLIYSFVSKRLLVFVTKLTGKFNDAEEMSHLFKPGQEDKINAFWNS